MNFLEGFGTYKQVWQSVIRPPRQVYTFQALGPQIFRIRGIRVVREDFRLINHRGLQIECSLFKPESIKYRTLPCVIYLHGNCSSRLEALPLVPPILSREMCLCCLDFSGCGLSQGEYISLGYFEKQDLATVVEFLSTYHNIGQLSVWGRSMGASTCLMSSDLGDDIKCLVLDSPFESLKKLCVDHASNQMGFPETMTKYLFKILRKTIIKRASFDIDQIEPIRTAGQFRIPAYFIAAKDDALVPITHSQQLYLTYAGVKNFALVEGDHNTIRSEMIVNAISNFFAQHMRCNSEDSARNPGLPFQVTYGGVPPRTLFRENEASRLACAGDIDRVKVEDDSTRFYNIGDVDEMLSSEEGEDIDIDNLPVD